MRFFSQLIGFVLFLFSCDEAPENKNYEEKSLYKVFDLPNELAEASGIIIYDSLLWTINDSDNETILFGIDSANGSIRKKITLQDAINTDWEDITQDEAVIYVGDIGNSSGSRDTLNIYSFNKTDICDSAEQKTNTYKISFSFEDQIDFEPASLNTPFDCEALISIDDSLYIFTKDWVNSRTVMYSLPKSPGYYKANRITDFNVNGLVAGVGYNPQTKQIALCGYTENYIPFITLVDVSYDLIIDEPDLVRHDLYENFGVQIEGIGYAGERIFLVSENSAQLQAFFEFR